MNKKIWGEEKCYVYSKSDFEKGWFIIRNFGINFHTNQN